MDKKTSFASEPSRGLSLRIGTMRGPLLPPFLGRAPRRAAAGLFAVAAVAACSSEPVRIPPSPGSPLGPTAGVVANPRSLGVITLGEEHSSKGGAGAAVVSVSFIPYGKPPASCWAKVDGCDMARAPRCGVTPGSVACSSAETCVWDDSCAATCKALQSCDATCSDGQECYIAANGKGACRAPQSFDAGPLAFSGTTAPLTLFPPYTYEAVAVPGAPFLALADMRVQAGGAARAGFVGFDAAFRSTSFVQTSPSLHTIPRSAIFGNDPLPIGWVPGGDHITLELTGTSAVARCQGDDGKGAFTISRAVLNEVMGSNPRSLSIRVTRQRVDTKTDVPVKGTLYGTPLPDRGDVQLVTSSSETAQLAGCGDAETSCGDRCVDLRSAATDCGACDSPCRAGQICSLGRCLTATVPGGGAP